MNLTPLPLCHCVLFVVLSVPAAAHKSAAAFMPLTGVGMFAFGLGMTRLFAWFSRGDPAWLSEVIRTALRTKGQSGLRFLATAYQFVD